MTVDEIAAGLEDQHREWIIQHQGEIERVSGNPAVQARIVHFIEESTKHPNAVAGSPIEAVRRCLKLSSTANFRLGLLIGLMLDRPIEPLTPQSPYDERQLQLEVVEEQMVEPCDSCKGFGLTCITCGLSRHGTALFGHEFSPVRCDACEGKGTVSI